MSEPGSTGPAQDDARRRFLDDVAAHLGRALSQADISLATSLMTEKSAALVARELEAAPVADAEKIRPEHKDAADHASPVARDPR